MASRMRLDLDRPLRVCFATAAGPLHAADARNALFNYLLARKTGGSLVVRGEEREPTLRDEPSEDTVLRDLRWLGITWDEGPDVGGTAGPYRRSERGELYRSHAERLLASGAAYERDGATWFRMPTGTTVVGD